MTDNIICNRCGKPILNFGDITTIPSDSPERFYHGNCARKIEEMK